MLQWKLILHFLVLCLSRIFLLILILKTIFLDTQQMSQHFQHIFWPSLYSCQKTHLEKSVQKIVTSKVAQLMSYCYKSEKKNVYKNWMPASRRGLGGEFSSCQNRITLPIHREIEWVEELATTGHRFIKGIVGGVDLTLPPQVIREQIEGFRYRRNFWKKGFRTTHKRA